MIKINMNKAKEITHTLRRNKRAEEFAPYDEVIAKQIPGSNLQEAEVERQKIREKYITIQEEIDMATTPEELKNIIDRENHKLG